jgi:SAM-dependent methyltransferase
MKCKICYSSDTEYFLENPPIISCNACKNSFRLYSPIEITKVYKKGIAMPKPLANQLRNKHHYNFIDTKIGFSNIYSILEIGPGSGSLVRFIRKRNRNIKITVIEPGIFFAKELGKIENVTVLNDFIENVKIDNTSFDLVIMSHVLEHLENPHDILKYIYTNFLKNNNFLYIDIPNKDYELRNIPAAIVAPQIHLFFFDGVGIQNLLFEIGSKNDQILGNKYSTLPIGFLRRMEKLGELNDKKSFVTIFLKIINRISLLFSTIFRFTFFKYPKEINLNVYNSSFNNIAIIVKKQK